jgi:hypothetical protein
MIDFAHSICASTTDETSASNNDMEPDKGYLFGLECLTKVFKEMSTEGKNSSPTINIDN